MNAGLNLTDDQKQRIAEAKTPEEQAAILAQAMSDGSELSVDELEAVNGGAVVLPGTHDDINSSWDIVQEVMDEYGTRVAEITAFELGLLPDLDNNYLAKKSIADIRAWMHGELDGTNNKSIDFWGKRGKAKGKRG